MLLAVMICKPSEQPNRSDPASPTRLSRRNQHHQQLARSLRHLPGPRRPRDLALRRHPFRNLRPASQSLCRSVTQQCPTLAGSNRYLAISQLAANHRRKRPGQTISSVGEAARLGFEAGKTIGHHHSKISGPGNLSRTTKVQYSPAQVILSCSMTQL